MTTLSKILVFINLLFAFIVFSLIVVAFTTRTHWAKGYFDKVEENNRIQANYALRDQQKLEIIADSNKKLKDKDNELLRVNNELQLREKIEKDAVAKLAEAIRRVDESDATVKRLTGVTESLKVEIESLDKRLAAEQKRVLDLGLQNKEYKAKEIKATTDLQTALERNDQLLTKLVESDKKIAFLEGDAAAKAGQREAKNPPPEDVKGRVTATDDSSGYVTINLGSDNGVNKGNTLEVYRLKPRPTYVGTLRVYEVRPNEAIGKLIGTGPRGRIVKDDEVASRILAGQ